MWDDVVDVCEIQDRLRDSKVLEYARCFEVELDVASRVGGWVGFNQRAVQAQVRCRGMNVNYLIGAARVHGVEKGPEEAITEIATLEIGVERNTCGSERVERIHGLTDGVLGIWQRDDSVEREAVWVRSCIRCGLLIDQSGERYCGCLVAGINIRTGRRKG